MKIFGKPFTDNFPSASFLYSFAIAFAIYGFLAKSISLWGTKGWTFISTPGLSLIIAGVLCLVAFKLARFDSRLLSIDIRAFASILVILFFSDWLCRSYNLLQGPLVRGEIILFAIFGYFIIRKRYSWPFTLFAFIGPLLLFYCFFETSQGRLLFSDDHATFLYRLSLLKRNFPFIPFYNPEWNGGVDARDFFATGTLNLFFLSAPLVYLFEILDVYNAIIALLLFVFVPLCVYYAAKIERLHPPAPAIAVILSISASLLWYRWGLRYGTMGFITTSALIPLNLALVAKILDKWQEISRPQALLSILTITLMLFWSPSGLVFLPAIIYGVFCINRLVRKKNVLLIVASLVVINLPWVLVFWSASNVSKFLVTQKPVEMITQDRTPSSYAETETPPAKQEKTANLNYEISMKVLREAAHSTNPLLVLLIFPGLALFRRRQRRLYISIYLWLLFLGSAAVPLIPQLELDRMLVILSFCGSLPAALCIQRLLRHRESHPFYRTALAALIFGFLFAGLFSSGAIVKNRSIVPYYFASSEVSELTEAIKQNHGGGRVLFSGCVLHNLSRGHLAPLAYMTEVPLIASSQVHDLWRYKEVIPFSFRQRNYEGIKDYLDTFNVTAVIAHDKSWKRYFAERRDNFKLVWKGKNFSIFRRLDYQSNYFLEGYGSLVSQNSNSMTVALNSPDALIKFNYLPFLQSTQCELRGQDIAKDISFIKLSKCPLNTPITIRSKSVLARF